MGYRSEVIFGVRKKHEKKLEKVLKKHDMSLWFDSVERNHEYQEDGKWIKDSWVIYSGEHLKWYDTYDEVKEIINFIDDVCDKSKGDNSNGDGDSFMVCMGEDGEIHNECGEYWNYVDVIKAIEVI